MASASGGRRRKRGNAERLYPVEENATATSRLFDAPVAASTHRRDQPPRSLPPSATAYQPLPTDGPSDPPLVRYEWRTAAGDVLVVEAAWPAEPPAGDDRPLDLRRTHPGPSRVVR